MAIRVGDVLEQSNRKNTVSTSDFFYLMGVSDIDFSVDKILESGDTNIVTTLGTKYVILDRGTNNITPLGLEDNDIVKYDGNEWIIYKDVSNPETNFGIIYDKETKLFYQYDPSEGWLVMLKSGQIDGGTFP